MRLNRKGFAVLAILILAATQGFAQELTEEEQQKMLAAANNPLANMTAFNIQNYYYADLYGTDDSANTAWLRFVKPFGKWLFRASLPISTVPTPSTADPVSGLGDLNMFAAYLLSDPSAPAQFGVGQPEFTVFVEIGIRNPANLLHSTSRRASSPIS